MRNAAAASISILVLSLAARALWELDANPLLFAYDAYATRAAGGRAVTVGGDGRRRRAFPPGTTPLEGRTAWITGASSGIGAELAIHLSLAGAGRLILSGRNATRLGAVAESCRAASESRRRTWEGARGTEVSVVPFDASAGPEALDEAVSSALERASPSGIDVLVLNAGQYQCGTALDLDLERASPELMRVNFHSPVLLSQKLIREDGWRERGWGHVVIVSSILGRGVSPLTALYSATKHALRGYFHALAAEEGSWLRVDVVLPGATDTGLWSGSWDTTRGGRDEQRGGAVVAPRGRARNHLHADDRAKMSVGRSARLITSSMIGPGRLFFESWITRNPGLLWVYLASHEPTTFYYVNQLIIAPVRMGMWRERGEDALYLPTLISHMWGWVVAYFGGTA